MKTLKSYGVLKLMGSKVTVDLLYRASVKLKRLPQWWSNTVMFFCPYTLDHTDDGEMFNFDLERTVPMIIKSHCLDEIAQTHSIACAESIDGAQITKNLSMVAAT
jgi:hypothetical protein